VEYRLGMSQFRNPRIVILTSLKTHHRECAFNAGCFFPSPCHCYIGYTWASIELSYHQAYVGFCLGDVTSLCVRYVDGGVYCASAYVNRSYIGASA
jgi:hypothetical protein